MAYSDNGYDPELSPGWRLTDPLYDGHERWKEWRKNTGTDLLNYTGDDPKLQYEKIKQMANQEYEKQRLASDSLDDAFYAGYDAAYYEMTHPFAGLNTMVPGGVSPRTVLDRKRAAQHTIRFEHYPDIIKKHLTTARKARAEARADTRKARRSTIKTALLSAALGAAATQGANLYMGANQPQPPQPPQAQMSFPSGMQQSLADLTRMGRGKKNTRRRRKNRK
jgi:hypothetical protein